MSPPNRTRGRRAWRACGTAPSQLQTRERQLPTAALAEEPSDSHFVPVRVALKELALSTGDACVEIVLLGGAVIRVSNGIEVEALWRDPFDG